MGDERSRFLLAASVCGNVILLATAAILLIGRSGRDSESGTGSDQTSGSQPVGPTGDGGTGRQKGLERPPLIRSASLPTGKLWMPWELIDNLYPQAVSFFEGKIEIDDTFSEILGLSPEQKKSVEGLLLTHVGEIKDLESQANSKLYKIEALEVGDWNILSPLPPGAGIQLQSELLESMASIPDIDDESPHSVSERLASKPPFATVARFKLDEANENRIRLVVEFSGGQTQTYAIYDSESFESASFRLGHVIRLEPFADRFP